MGVRKIYHADLELQKRKNCSNHLCRQHIVQDCKECNHEPLHRQEHPRPKHISAACLHLFGIWLMKIVLPWLDYVLRLQAHETIAIQRSASSLSLLTYHNSKTSNIMWPLVHTTSKITVICHFRKRSKPNQHKKHLQTQNIFQIHKDHTKNSLNRTRTSVKHSQIAATNLQIVFNNGSLAFHYHKILRIWTWWSPSLPAYVPIAHWAHTDFPARKAPFELKEKGSQS